MLFLHHSLSCSCNVYAVKEMLQQHKSVYDMLVANTEDIAIATEPSGASFKETVDVEKVAACHCPFVMQTTLPFAHIMACLLS